MKLHVPICSWKQYKYRFVPWVALNWRKKRKSIRRIENAEDYNQERELKIIDVLEKLFDVLDKAEQRDVTYNAAFENEFGFLIERKQSSIENAGHGVFVTSGCIPEHHIAAMYPGTIYYPSDPLLIQSIKNPFILRCLDGMMIDGKNKGISKYIFRSCCGRDILGSHKPCDTTWLTDDPKNPLAVGQFVNNQTDSEPANVVYQEFDIPVSFPLHLRKYLPNVYYQNRFLEEHFDNTENYCLMRIVVLMSLRQIKKNEELFSAYFTELY